MVVKVSIFILYRISFSRNPESTISEYTLYVYEAKIVKISFRDTYSRRLLGRLSANLLMLQLKKGEGGSTVEQYQQIVNMECVQDLTEPSY